MAPHSWTRLRRDDWSHRLRWIAIAALTCMLLFVRYGALLNELGRVNN